MRNRMTRRNFVKGAGVAAAGLGAAAVGLGGVAHATPGNVYPVTSESQFLDRVNNAAEGDVLILPKGVEWDFGTYDPDGIWIDGPKFITTVSLTVKCEDAETPEDRPLITGLGGWTFYSYADGTKWNFENVNFEIYSTPYNLQFILDTESIVDNFGTLPLREFMVMGGKTAGTRGNFYAKKCNIHSLVINSAFSVTSWFDENTYMNKVHIEDCEFTSVGANDFGLIMGPPTNEGDVLNPWVPEEYWIYRKNGYLDINQVMVNDCKFTGGSGGANFGNSRGKNKVMFVDNTCTGNGETGIDLVINRGQYDGALFKGNKCHTGNVAGIFITETHAVNPTLGFPTNPSGYVRNCVFIDNDCTYTGPGERRLIFGFIPAFDLHAQNCQYNSFVNNNAPYAAFGEYVLTNPWLPPPQHVYVDITSNNNIYIDFNPESWVHVTGGSGNNIINAVGTIKPAAETQWPQWAIDKYNNM
jgi:hypothetical protein